eukprot:12226330-Heterocapsa_arctica.AAC.1
MERSVRPHPPTIPRRTRTILGREFPIFDTEAPICDTGASTDTRSTAWSHGVLDPNLDATGWTHRILVPRDEASNL